MRLSISINHCERKPSLPSKLETPIITSMKRTSQKARHSRQQC